MVPAPRTGCPDGSSQRDLDERFTFLVEGVVDARSGDGVAQASTAPVVPFREHGGGSLTARR